MQLKWRIPDSDSSSSWIPHEIKGMHERCDPKIASLVADVGRVLDLLVKTDSENRWLPYAQKRGCVKAGD